MDKSIRMIPFNRPVISGKELQYMEEAVKSGHISGDGHFTKACSEYFEKRYRSQKMLLTSSGTDALEMVALLLNIGPGDEVIMPSFNFVSAGNAFALRGADIIFVDSLVGHPNVNPEKVREAITKKTKAVVCVHYAGMSCDMDALSRMCREENIFLVEDAAHAIESRWRGKHQLGTIGDLGIFSFHETKNITCGEGGMLSVNRPELIERAIRIRDKGTNRREFSEGKSAFYEWVDLGSSFLPSELNAAFLFAQIENIEQIQQKRRETWNRYYQDLKDLNGVVTLPEIPSDAEQNGHLFYLVANNREERNKLIRFLNDNGVNAVFHYQALHKSKYYRGRYRGAPLPNAEHYSDALLRLPLFFSLTGNDQSFIIEKILEFYGR